MIREPRRDDHTTCTAIASTWSSRCARRPPPPPTNPLRAQNLDQPPAKPQLIAPKQNAPKRDLSQVYLLCLENQASARQGGHCRAGRRSVLGQPVLPVRQSSALQVAIGRGAPPNCESAAEAAHERRRMLIDQVPCPMMRIFLYPAQNLR